MSAGLPLHGRNPDPVQFARHARLLYVSDADHGIRRRRRGRGFEYVLPSGRPVRNAATLARIGSLAIPPAWRDVWICRRAKGHLQATGRDDRGRKQYMHNDHAEVNGSKIHFEFRGKGGVEHRIDLRDPRLAKIVARCQELPGQELFGYLDEENQPRDVTSSDVNEYIRSIAGRDFTARDFRTWTATALAALALAACESCQSKAAGRRNVNRAVERIAQRLGNTKAICRKSYIHPGVIQAYLDQSPLLTEMLPRSGQDGTTEPSRTMELCVLRFLRRLNAQSAKTRRRP